MEAIRFAITSTRVIKPNLKAIAHTYYTTYNIVLRYRNDILLEIGAAKRRNIKAKPRPALAFNEEVMHFVTQLLD